MKSSSETPEGIFGMIGAVLNGMDSKTATRLFRIFVAGGAFYLAMHLSDLTDAAVARSPAVKANREDVDKVASVVTSLKSSIDAIAAGQPRIFKALKDQQDALNELKLSVVDSRATLSTQVTDLGSRLKRIEDKQDK